MASVWGVAILDEEVAFHSSGEILPGAEKLLIRLRYSGMDVGLHCPSGLCVRKTRALEAIGIHKEDVKEVRSMHELLDWDWSKIRVLVSAEKNLHAFHSSLDEGWCFFTVSEEDRSRQVDGIPFAIAGIISKKKCSTFVGHCMSWKREKEFLQRHALPIFSNAGLVFGPLSLSSSLELQLDSVQIVLSKATDEILSVLKAKTSSDTIFSCIIFSDRFKELDKCLRARPSIHVIDPIDRVAPLMDRAATHALLQELPAIEVVGGGTVRPPRCVKVTRFDEPALVDMLKNGRLVGPTIVKPQIACGASESHTMAIVFENHGYAGLSVPLPAVVQEYVEHQPVIYKIYVLGKKVFCSRRTSTPDAVVLRSMFSELPAIIFDSLKTLPTGAPIEDQNTVLKPDMKAVESTAALLLKKLKLTIFGFDVVIESSTHDHVVVDVNYFPSFKDVPDAEGIPAFWTAVQASKELHHY